MQRGTAGSLISWAWSATIANEATMALSHHADLAFTAGDDFDIGATLLRPDGTGRMTGAGRPTCNSTQPVAGFTALAPARRATVLTGVYS